MSDSINIKFVEFDKKKWIYKIISDTPFINLDDIRSKISKEHGIEFTKNDLKRVIDENLADLVVKQGDNYSLVRESILSDKIDLSCGMIEFKDVLVAKDIFELKTYISQKFIELNIKPNTGNSNLDQLIRSIVKDNVITETEENFLKSKAIEYGLDEKVIGIAKSNLRSNNPYLDNLIHIVYEDGIVTQQEIIFLREKTLEETFSLYYSSRRFWVIGFSEYLPHLAKNEVLLEIILLLFILIKLDHFDDLEVQIFDCLDIFKFDNYQKSIEYAKEELKKLVIEDLNLNYNIQARKIESLLSSLDNTLKDAEIDSIENEISNPDLFFKLLDQERYRIGTPDADLLVENVKFKLNNKLYN